MRRPPRSTQSRSSAASDVYKRQGYAGRRRLEAVAAVNQDHTLGLVGTFGDKVQGPVERGIAATDDHQIFACKVSRVFDPVKQLAVVKFLQTLDPQQLGLE